MSIKTKLQGIFNEMLEKDLIRFPPREITELWEDFLELWIQDVDLDLFVRKGGNVRGSEFANVDFRRIICVDNMPAQWVFRKLVIDNEINDYDTLKKLLLQRKLPICFIASKVEKETLSIHQIRSKDTDITSLGYKLAHIDAVIMKRGKNLVLKDYQDHHRRLLSLKNMYLIDKAYGGIAEIQAFNDIVKEYCCQNTIM